MRYFVVVSETDIREEEMKNMRIWASQPWETNIVHVEGGLVMLEADSELWAERAVTKFCPLAHSPMTENYEMEIYGFQHVKDSGYCGEKVTENTLSQGVDNVDQCAALASGAGYHSFLFGNSFRRGYCIGGTIDVTVDMYKEWQANKENPSCSVGDGWSSTMLYDFYAMEPVGMKEAE